MHRSCTSMQLLQTAPRGCPLLLEALQETRRKHLQILLLKLSFVYEWSLFQVHLPPNPVSTLHLHASTPRLFPSVSGLGFLYPVFFSRSAFLLALYFILKPYQVCQATLKRQPPRPYQHTQAVVFTQVVGHRVFSE